MKQIYTGFSDRLYLLNEKNKCLFIGSLPKKDFFDLSSYEEIIPFLKGERRSFTFNKNLSSEKYYVGYPYLFITKQNHKYKAPLLFYPVLQQDGCMVSDGEPILNRALFLALFPGKKARQLLNKIINEGHLSLGALSVILNENGFKIPLKCDYRVAPFIENAIPSNKPKVLYYVVMGKFPVMSSMQEDYHVLYQKNAYNNAIMELFCDKNVKVKDKRERIYLTEKLDYSQKKALQTQKNIVVFGPPGTGKSQTIAGIIGNEIANGRNVLVVSEKKVALDVIDKRLEWLNGASLLLSDPVSQKETFYKQALENHLRFSKPDGLPNEILFSKEEHRMGELLSIITENDKRLHCPTPFGPSLVEMYQLSASYPKDEKEKYAYERLSSLRLTDSYEKLSEEVEFIKNSRLIERFCEYKRIFDNNNLAAHIAEVDITALNEARKCIGRKVKPFPISAYDNAYFILPYLLREKVSFYKVADAVLCHSDPVMTALRKLSLLPPFWLIFPFVNGLYLRRKRRLAEQIRVFFDAISTYLSPLLPIKKIFDIGGWEIIVNSVIHGADCRKEISEAIDNYLTIKKLRSIFRDLTPEIKDILLYCYDTSDKTASGMLKTLETIIPIRTYKLLLRYEKELGENTLNTAQFDVIRSTLSQKKPELIDYSRSHAIERIRASYQSHLRLHPEKNKHFLFRLENGSWDIKKAFLHYSDYYLKIFPCILVSPENVGILPLVKNMFDTVIFDEASQLCPESSIPAIYRGKRVVICGDNKQLPPSFTFSRKQQEDAENDAFEARSLLDLAIAKLHPVYLQYHYRSQHSRLIDFSNRYFYESKLYVAPDITKNLSAISWIKVPGKRQDGKNVPEARKVVELIEKYRNCGTIGIITFNAPQMELIKEKIEDRCKKDKEFMNSWQGFVKNIENVQGEECDVIIFSIGFAKGDNEKVAARYGFLATDGGEKRLNVAITRAKKSIVIVSSVEPEELPVDTTKNSGPKLLRKYLEYAKRQEIPVENNDSSGLRMTEMEKKLMKRLQNIGYEVHPLVGTTGYVMSMAIYDGKEERYLLGIEFDHRSLMGAGESEEREVDKLSFLESKGWQIYRVWSRDFWLSPQNVVSGICQAAEKNRVAPNNKDKSASFERMVLTGKKFGQNGASELAE